MQWTEERKAQVKELAAKGFAGSNIAKILSAEHGETITRSMVGGVAARNGIKLTYRSHPPKPIGEKPKPKIAAPAVTKPASGACKIWELTRTRCRYPLWPDQYLANPNYFYCGAYAEKGSPYCQVHSKIVFRAKLGVA